MTMATDKEQLDELEDLLHRATDLAQNITENLEALHQALKSDQIEEDEDGSHETAMDNAEEQADEVRSVSNSLENATATISDINSNFKS